jgi:DNA-binding response OmpR family regulator
MTRFISARFALLLVFKSLNNDQRTRRAVFSKGANDYVTKPFQFQDLLTRVQSLLVNK